MFLMEFRWIF